MRSRIERARRFSGSISIDSFRPPRISSFSAANFFAFFALSFACAFKVGRPNRYATSAAAMRSELLNEGSFASPRLLDVLRHQLRPLAPLRPAALEGVIGVGVARRRARRRSYAAAAAASSSTCSSSTLRELALKVGFAGGSVCQGRFDSKEACDGVQLEPCGVRVLRGADERDELRVRHRGIARRIESRGARRWRERLSGPHEPDGGFEIGPSLGVV